MTKPQTLGEGLDRVMRYQLYKSIGLLILAGLMYLSEKNKEKKRTANEDGFIIFVILWIFLGLVALGLLVSHPRFAIGVWIALTLIGVVVRARRKAAVH